MMRFKRVIFTQHTIQLAFYIVDCELTNIGAMRYINGLTMNKKQVKSLVLYLFWTVTIRQNHS